MGEGPNRVVWTVAELSQQLKQAVEGPLGDVWVKGELSGCKPSTAGHLYFSIKDDQALVQAAFFGWAKRKVAWRLQDGLEVICHGRMSLYAPRGSVQLIVDRLEPLGSGALQLAFEQLKAKLQAEGLFDPNQKRSLPVYPRRVAVITSPQAAALQDFLTVLGRRAPQVSVTLVPAAVQGAQAAASLCAALSAVLKRLEVESTAFDLVVLTRGGGSLEDLWCFNDEALARAIRKCPVPVISAVGHEVDFTISDFVADLRAPTPSAAAEVLSSAWVAARQGLPQWQQQLAQRMRERLAAFRERWGHWSLRVVHPLEKIRDRAQRVDEWEGRLHRTAAQRHDRAHALWQTQAQKLNALSPRGVLNRGYAIVLGPTGQPLTRVAGLEAFPESATRGVELELQFSDGTQRVKTTGAASKSDRQDKPGSESGVASRDGVPGAHGRMGGLGDPAREPDGP